MSSYTKCPDKETCQKVIAEMERRGIQYVPNHAHLPHDGINYVKQNGFLFSTCSETEFELNNESDELDI